MPIPTTPLATLRARFRGYMRNRNPTKAVGPKRFLGQLAETAAMYLLGLHAAVEAAANDSPPTQYSSAQGIASWASLYGLPSGVAGAYGPSVAQPATGGQATITGTKGTPYADQALLVDESGAVSVKLDGAVSIPGSAPGSGSVLGLFVAVTPGEVGNLPVGTKLRWVTPPGGADPTVTLSTALSDGTDAEEPEQTLARLEDRLQTPPAGGRKHDYRTWALDAAGIVDAFVYANRSGGGTVDVVVLTAGTGTERIPSEVQRLAAAAAIASNRPAGVNTINVLLPYMPTARTLRTRIVPSLPIYAFDWASGGTALTVDLYTAGSPASIRLPGLAPASLKDAIDAGNTPRLQVLSTGGEAVNVAVRVTAWADGGGKTTLTLENPLPQGWATPSVSDKIYPGGPAVASIAQAQLDYVDALGPSKASGYADPDRVWSDTLALAQLERVALDTADADETKFADNITACTIDGVAADVTGADTTLNGPELLRAGFVAVTD